MKLAHTADLHIGKMLHECSLLEDQEYILQEIIDILVEEKVKGLIIAGDVYDRSVPAADAVEVLDKFLSKLAKQGIQVFMISGNHDSAQRLSFARNILREQQIYIAGTLETELDKISLEDEYGKVNLYLLPFAKPPVMRHALKVGEEKGYQEEKRGQLSFLESIEEEEIEMDSSLNTYEECVKACIDKMNVQEEERNILVTHHFVTNMGQPPEESDSESNISVGGTENIDVAIFDSFDYVALGHIHGPQKIKRGTVRYSGTPLKYSFSEVYHNKSLTIIELREKGNVVVNLRPLYPLRDMRKIKGTLSELLREEVYTQGNVEDYLHVTLTDKEEIIDPIGKLRSVYKNVLQLVLERNLGPHEDSSKRVSEVKKKNPLDIFEEFYCAVSDREFNEEKKKIMVEIIDEVMHKES